jgi:hypothetical protein
MDLEPEDLGLVAARRLGGHERGVHLEEHRVEGGAEVGAVDDGVARGLGVVDVFAAWAVEFDRGRVGDVGLAEGEEWLRVAEDPGAAAEVGFFEFLELISDELVGIMCW